MYLKPMGNGKVTFGGWRNNRNVRRVFSIEEVWTRLGFGDHENLKRGALPIKFEDFCRDEFIPKDLKMRVRFNARSLQTLLANVSRLGDFFAGDNLHEIDIPAWERFRTAALTGKLSSGRSYSHNTVIHTRAMLVAILDYAVRRGLIRLNPLLGSDPVLKPESRRDRWVTKEQLDLLINSATHPLMKTAIELAALTGAREGELRLMRVENVDWKSGEIRIPTLKRRDRKSGQPISPDAAARFLKIASLGPRSVPLLRRIAPLGSSGMLFPGRFGDRPRSAKWFGEEFVSTVKAAGLTDLHFHDLRGSFIVHRAMVIRDFRQLQLEVGHLSPSSIEHYLAVLPRHAPEQSIFFDPAAAHIAEQIGALTDSPKRIGG